MSPKLLTALLLALVLGSVGAPHPAGAAAQETESSTPARSLEESPENLSFDDEVAVTWTLVPVVVRSERGYVTNLERDDFRLFVDGERVEITELDRGEDAPVSLVFLQDLSGSMANSGKLDASQRAVRTFLANSRPEDEVAMASFAGERLRVDVPFTGDLTTVEEVLDTWKGYGTTALHDAVSFLPQISDGGRYGHRVAILVTDGQDNASNLAPGEAFEIVRRARLPVYVLGLGVGGAFRREEGEDAGDYRYEDLLRELALRTGGRYYDVDNPAEIDRAVEGILDDLRLRYVLAVTTASQGPRTFHPIRVEIRRPGRFTLTHKSGYHGTRPIAREGRR